MSGYFNYDPVEFVKKIIDREEAPYESFNSGVIFLSMRIRNPNSTIRISVKGLHNRIVENCQAVSYLSSLDNFRLCPIDGENQQFDEKRAYQIFYRALVDGIPPDILNEKFEWFTICCKKFGSDLGFILSKNYSKAAGSDNVFEPNYPKYELIPLSYIK